MEGAASLESRAGKVATFMKHKLFKRWVAMLLVLAMCVSCVPAAVFAEEGEEETRSQIGTEEQTQEDASAQLGEYTPPAADPEQETEPPAEEPAEAAPPETEGNEAKSEETEPVRSRELPAAASAPAVPVQGNMANEGRASADQQVLKVEGTDYILIGTRQQLLALDYYPETPAVGNASSDQITENRRYDVTGPIWRVTEKRDSYLSNNWYESGRELVYPGDNNLTGSFKMYPLYGENDCITDPNHGAADTHKLGETVVTRQERHGLINYDMEMDYYGGAEP